MNAKYWDIRTLSVEDERVPCETRVEFAGLGPLDPTCMDEDLPEASKVEVPLWLAQRLKNSLYIGQHKHYNERFREDLQAGPLAKNLRERSPHYFSVGEALATLTADNDLQQSLKVAYTGDRFNRIMDLAFNSQDEDVTEDQRKFTDAELDLFTAGAQAAKAFSQWKSRNQSSLRASSAVSSSSNDPRR